MTRFSFVVSTWRSLDTRALLRLTGTLLVKGAKGCLSLVRGAGKLSPPAVKEVVMVVALCSGCWIIYKTFSVPRDLRTRAINFMKREPQLPSNLVRTNFMDMEFVSFREPANHTHGAAAADRSTSSLFIDRLARIFGRPAYYVQRSRNDEKHNRLGSRSYYWVKDVTTTPRNLSIPDTSFVAMVDVDQYVDMPTFLVDHCQPTILFTFQPSRVCRATDNYSFTFDKDDVVDYHVTGGGRYSHQVWNWSTDHILVSKKFCGIPYSSAAFLVDRRFTSPDHELVMLTPIGSWSFPGSLLVHWWLGARQLQRLRVATPKGFLRLTTSSKTGVHVSTGKVNTYISADVTAAVDDTVAAIVRLSKYDVTMPTIMSFVPEGDKAAGAALLEYHRSQEGVKPDIVCPVPMAVRPYQFMPNSYDPLAKPMMKAFMTPLVHAAFVPSDCKNNEEECIRARVEQPRNTSLLPPSPFLVRVMQEFAEKFIPEHLANTLDPTDDDEVLSRMDRPQQRRLLAAAEFLFDPKRVINMFMKKEPYGNIKPPRPISTFNTSDKREYSKFIYALEAFLKKEEWYAFGKTPRDISARVVKILEHALFATPTDYAKFDGHGSDLMREFEKIILSRAFRPIHTAKAMELHASQYGLRAYGRFDSAYDSGYSRGSGSPETSVFNTIFNAFIAYLGNRMTKIDGLYLSVDESWNRLGIYGGDDGLTAGISPEVYKKAASWVGQELSIDVIKRGEPGIQFLARVYSPAVWEGNPASCCDIKRQISKFHVTINLDRVTPKMKLLEKVRSFLLTDSSTPIIGDFCRAAFLLQGEGEIKPDERTAQIRRWKSMLPLEAQYDNTPGDWMMEYVERTLPDFDYKKFTAWLDKADTFEKLLSPPMFMEPPVAKPTQPVVIEDEILLPIVPKEGKVNMSPIDQKKVEGIGVPLPIPMAVSKNRKKKDKKKLSVPSELKHMPTKMPVVEKVLKKVVENLPTPEFKGRKLVVRRQWQSWAKGNKSGLVAKPKPKPPPPPDGGI